MRRHKHASAVSAIALTKQLLAAGVCADVFLDGCRRLGVFRLLAVLHREAPEVSRIDNALVAGEFTDSLQQANASADFQHTHVYLSVAVKPVHVWWRHLGFNAKVSSEGAQDIGVKMS